MRAFPAFRWHYPSGGLALWQMLFFVFELAVVLVHLLAECPHQSGLQVCRHSDFTAQSLTFTRIHTFPAALQENITDRDTTSSNPRHHNRPFPPRRGIRGTRKLRSAQRRTAWGGVGKTGNRPITQARHANVDLKDLGLLQPPDGLREERRVVNVKEVPVVGPALYGQRYVASPYSVWKSMYGKVISCAC